MTTQAGQTIKIVGFIPEHGSWNTASAVALSARGYTNSNPLWSVTVSLAAGTTFQYKFINVASNGAVSWESDPSRQNTVAATASSSWHYIAQQTYLVFITRNLYKSLLKYQGFKAGKIGRAHV